MKFRIKAKKIYEKVVEVEAESFSDAIKTVCENYTYNQDFFEEDTTVSVVLEKYLCKQR